MAGIMAVSLVLGVWRAVRSLLDAVEHALGSQKWHVRAICKKD
jgi:hypothetical protein